MHRRTSGLARVVGITVLVQPYSDYHLLDLLDDICDRKQLSPMHSKLSTVACIAYVGRGVRDLLAILLRAFRRL